MWRQNDIGVSPFHQVMTTLSWLYSTPSHPAAMKYKEYEYSHNRSNYCKVSSICTCNTHRETFKNTDVRMQEWHQHGHTSVHTHAHTHTLHTHTTHTHASWCRPLKFSDSGVLSTDLLSLQKRRWHVKSPWRWNWRPQKKLKVIARWWKLAAQMFGCLECATSQTLELHNLVHCNLSWQREYQLPLMLMALKSDSTPTGHRFLVP